jgi:hypothetical protein
MAHECDQHHNKVGDDHRQQPAELITFATVSSSLSLLYLRPQSITRAPELRDSQGLVT